MKNILFILMIIAPLSLISNSTMSKAEYENFIKEEKKKQQIENEKYNTYLESAKEYENSKSYLKRLKAYEYYVEIYNKKRTTENFYRLTNLSNKEWMYYKNFTANTYHNKPNSMFASINFKLDYSNRIYFEFTISTKDQYITKFDNVYLQGSNNPGNLILGECSTRKCLKTNKVNSSKIEIPITYKHLKRIQKGIYKNNMIVISYKTNKGPKHFKFALKNATFAIDKLLLYYEENK